MSEVFNDDYAKSFFKKGICCRYLLEPPRLVDSIVLSTHNLCFYREPDKKV